MYLSKLFFLIIDEDNGCCSACNQVMCYFAPVLSACTIRLFPTSQIRNDRSKINQHIGL